MAAWIKTLARSSGSLYQAVGAFLMLSIAGLMSVDVMGRYFLNMPINGSYDMIEALMALCAFWFMPQLSRHKQHISVTLFRARAGWIARLQTVLIELLSCGGAVLMSWCLFVIAGEYNDMQEASMVLGLPKAPIVYTCAGVSALMALAHLTNVLISAVQPGKESQQETAS